MVVVTRSRWKEGGIAVAEVVVVVVATARQGRSRSPVMRLGAMQPGDATRRPYQGKSVGWEGGRSNRGRVESDEAADGSVRVDGEVRRMDVRRRVGSEEEQPTRRVEKAWRRGCWERHWGPVRGAP